MRGAVQDSDEGNPHSMPRRAASPTPSIQSTISNLPMPQALSPTDPLPPAFLHRPRAAAAAGAAGHVSFPSQSALRNSVVADEEPDESASQAEQEAAAGGKHPRRNGAGTDDEEIVRSPTMMNPVASTRKRNNKNRKRKKNPSRTPNEGEDGKTGSRITTQPASPTPLPPAAPHTTSPTSPTSRHHRRASQFSHVHPPPSSSSPAPTRNMAGVGYHWLSNTGSEPGVDVTQDVGDYANLTTPVRVTIVDYSSDGQGTRVDVPGKKLKMWLNSPDGQRPVQPRPGTQGDDKDRPRSVRWINVDGINFEILKFLTLRYGLHPLAVEDTLRATNNPRSKLDFYANHLYCQILVQHIRPQDHEEIKRTARLRGGNGVRGAGYGSTGESPPLEESEEDDSDGDGDETATGGSTTAETYQSSGQAESGTTHKPSRRPGRRKPRSSSASSAKRAQEALRARTSWWGRLFRLGGGTGKTSLPEGVEGVFEPMQTTQPGHANTVGSFPF